MTDTTEAMRAAFEKLLDEVDVGDIRDTPCGFVGTVRFPRQSTVFECRQVLQAALASQTVAVPEGWRFIKVPAGQLGTAFGSDKAYTVYAPNGSAVVVRPVSDSIAETILHMLAESIAEAPAADREGA